MENNILNKINSIIVTETQNSENMMSLLEFIELMNNINTEINNKCVEVMKKMNNKLSKNVALFDYEIKNITINGNITLVVNHELKNKEIVISKDQLKIISGFKTFPMELIYDDFEDLIRFYNNYSYLDNILIKCKYSDININITRYYIEIFMYKSPNWITMGKAFSLKYDIQAKKFNYELDYIKLKDDIKNQEKLLFSKIFFEKNLLPNEIQVKNEYYMNHKLENKKNSLLSKLLTKIRNMMKK